MVTRTWVVSLGITKLKKPSPKREICYLFNLIVSIDYVSFEDEVSKLAVKAKVGADSNAEPSGRSILIFPLTVSPGL